MSGFDEREKGFEKKFAHDAELKFKAEARRNKMLAEWAGAKMGMGEDEITSYIKDVRRSDLEEAGDDDVFRKVRGDFDAKNIDQSDHQIRRTMDELLATAMEQIQSEA